MWSTLQTSIDSRPRLTLVTLLIFVFVVRLIVAGVILYPDRPDRYLNTDQWGGIAKNLIDGYGYVGGQGHVKPEDAEPNSERGPVPVYFFAGLFLLFGYDLWAVMIGNWLCDVATAYILYRITREVFIKRRVVSYLSVLGWALYIPEVTITRRAYSEPLFTLLLAVHIWTIMKLRERASWRMALLSGILLGAAALSRPIMLTFLPVVWILLWCAKGCTRATLKSEWLKQATLTSAVLSVAFVLTLLPWVVRNLLVFDAFIPGGSLLGYNLVRNNYYLNTENYVSELQQRGFVAATIEEELQARGDTLAGKSPVEIDLIYRRIALERIKAHPDRYLIVTGYRFLRLWFNLGYGTQPSMQSYMVAAANMLLLALAIAAFVRPVGSWIHTGQPALWIIMYTVIMHIPFHAQVRFIFPVIPYVIMFSSFTLTRVGEMINHRRFSKTALAP